MAGTSSRLMIFLPIRSTVEERVAALDAEGFYRYAWPGYDWSARVRSAKAGDALTEETGRVFTLDAEVVYESGAEDFVREIEPLLRALGAPIDDFENLKRPGWWGMRLNGSEVMLVAQDDAEAGSGWHRAGIRLLRAIDGLLETSPAQERVYYDHIDNDSTVAFLTPRMLDLLSELAVATGRPKPGLSRPQT